MKVIYEDLYDKHIKKCKQLLEKGIITEDDFINIKEKKINAKAFNYLEEEIINENDNNNNNDNNRTVSAIKKKFVKFLVLIENIVKILFAVFSMFTASIIKPYGIHTVLWIFVAILLLPIIQNKIASKTNKKITKLIIMLICIIMYFTAIMIS